MSIFAYPLFAPLWLRSRLPFIPPSPSLRLHVLLVIGLDSPMLYPPPLRLSC